MLFRHLLVVAELAMLIALAGCATQNSPVQVDTERQAPLEIPDAGSKSDNSKENPQSKTSLTGQAKIEKALKELMDDNWHIRGDAVKALGELGAEKYAKDIAEHLKNKDAKVRDNAIRALEELGAKEYVKDIAEVLKDEDAKVRSRAVSALGLLGAKEYIKDIAGLLKDKDTKVRGNAIVALGWLKTKEYVKDIAELLKDKDAFVRSSAIVALGKFGTKEYADEIGKLINDLSECYIYDEVKGEGRETTVSAEAERVLKEWNQLPADSERRTEKDKETEKLKK